MPVVLLGRARRERCPPAATDAGVWKRGRDAGARPASPAPPGGAAERRRTAEWWPRARRLCTPPPADGGDRALAPRHHPAGQGPLARVCQKKRSISAGNRGGDGGDQGRRRWRRQGRWQWQRRQRPGSNDRDGGGGATAAVASAVGTMGGGVTPPPPSTVRRAQPTPAGNPGGRNPLPPPASRCTLRRCRRSRRHCRSHRLRRSSRRCRSRHHCCHCRRWPDGVRDRRTPLALPPGGGQTPPTPPSPRALSPRRA